MPKPLTLIDQKEIKDNKILFLKNLIIKIKIYVNDVSLILATKDSVFTFNHIVIIIYMMRFFNTYFLFWLFFMHKKSAFFKMHFLK